MRILIVDDEPLKRSVMADELEAAGYSVTTATNPLEAEPILSKDHFDVVLTDLRMPGEDGLSFLRELKRQRAEQAVMVMTAYATVETAVAAMKLGAFDYIRKPFSTEELLLKLDKLRQYEHLDDENKALRRQLTVMAGEYRIIARSRVIRDVLTRMHSVADTDTAVLIEGESGTGKELIGHKIHEISHRAANPFVAVSCAALPKDLVEAELFGHEPGSFTGATRRRIGRFELAHGGTLFLDDVDDIPLEVQVKLLRVLQERTFERVGGEESIRTNVRVISATKNPLPAMVAAGRFREDLYYRLNVVPLRMPPLRERLEDIGPLVEYLLERIAIKLNRGALTVAHAVISKFQRYGWPGNIRELEHVLERMAALSMTDHLDEEDMPELPSSTSADQIVSLSLADVSTISMTSVLSEVETRLVQWALQKSQGNLARAAELLDIPRSTLQYKAAKLGKSVSQRPSEANGRRIAIC